MSGKIGRFSIFDSRFSIGPGEIENRESRIENSAGWLGTGAGLCLLLGLLAALPAARGAQPPARGDVLAAMKKAAAFFHDRVSTEGGYHYHYAADLSYGRSETAEGPTQVEVQREATPIVALAYLDAHALTGERVFLDYARSAARALVRGQLCSGGWDYLIEFDPEKRKAYQYRSEGNCAETLKGTTTLDDNVTQAAIRVLMRVDRALGFTDAAIHEASLFALNRLIAAQYPIGAWPQKFRTPPDPAKFPVKRASYPETWPRKWPRATYQHLYTFNDNATADTIDTLLEAARIYDEPRFRAAAEKGGQFILLAQMPDPQPAWSQQYDADMRPTWARAFEPPAISGGESLGVMKVLMVLYRETGDRKYLEPIPRALAYLRRSFVPRTGAEVFQRIPPGPVLARFYELETNRPLFITKGSRARVTGLGSQILDGYELTYSPDSVITHYGVLTSGRDLETIDAAQRKLQAGGAPEVRRPQPLRGLSPWAEEAESPSKPASATKIRGLVEALDERGAWTRSGIVGKSDLWIEAFAAKEMVLVINPGRAGGAGSSEPPARPQVIPLKENDTVSIFLGPQPPREQIIDSSDFAENLTALAEYYAAKP